MDFERFWAAYPNKVAKADARKAWAKLKPSPALGAKILDALAWQSESEQWTKDDGHFIPYPATWLRGERWEDERRSGTDRRQSPQGIQYECPHAQACGSRWACGQRQLMERRAG